MYWHFKRRNKQAGGVHSSILLGYVAIGFMGVAAAQTEEILRIGQSQMEVYGAFGSVLFILAIVIWFLYQEIKRERQEKIRQEERHDKEKEQMQEAYNKVIEEKDSQIQSGTDYLKTDSKENMEIVSRNTSTLQSLAEIIKSLK